MRIYKKDILRKFHDSEQFKKLLLRIVQDEDDEIDEDFTDDFEDEFVNDKQKCTVKPMYRYNDGDVQRLLDTIDRIAGFF